MTIQTREEVTVSRGDGGEQAAAEAVRAEAAVEVPADIQAKADQVINRYETTLKNQTEAYVNTMLDEEASTTEAGEPTLASGYQYWNCLTRGPYQFFGNPPYRPGKIIAADEWTLMIGVVWINPLNSDGGGLPGTIVLADRDYRVRFETINLSDITNGPDRLFTGTFGNPANPVNTFYWWFRPSDPGRDPNLYETTLTADIVQMAQPMAAFSTWHFDPDPEPPFLQLQGAGPRWQHDQPARFLVYRR